MYIHQEERGGKFDVLEAISSKSAYIPVEFHYQSFDFLNALQIWWIQRMKKR